MSLIDDKSHVDSVLEDVKERIGFTDYEIGIIKDIISIIEEPLPNTLAGAQNKVSKIDALRPRLINLIYVANKVFIKMDKEYSIKYNTEHTRLSKMGRASLGAIEAEVLKRDDVWDYKERRDYAEQVRWLLRGYLTSLDQSRGSNVERWKDNRKL